MKIKYPIFARQIVDCSNNDEKAFQISNFEGSITLQTTAERSNNSKLPTFQARLISKLDKYDEVVDWLEEIELSNSRNIFDMNDAIELFGWLKDFVVDQGVQKAIQKFGDNKQDLESFLSNYLTSYNLKLVEFDVQKTASGVCNAKEQQENE